MSSFCRIFSLCLFWVVPYSLGSQVLDLPSLFRIAERQEGGNERARTDKPADAKNIFNVDGTIKAGCEWKFRGEEPMPVSRTHCSGEREHGGRGDRRLQPGRENCQDKQPGRRPARVAVHHACEFSGLEHTGIDGAAEFFTMQARSRHSSESREPGAAGKVHPHIA